MIETSRHDAWQAGDNYDAYMGRWSRQIAPRFLDWFNAPHDTHWLEVGCGTGALTECILHQCSPQSLIAVDPSSGFIALAEQKITDTRVRFEVGDAQMLAVQSASKDVVVSALVLNFIPDRLKALSEMKRVCAEDGLVGFYVWDYPGGGIEFMRAFWNAAGSLDPNALELAEGTRFPFCTQEGLIDLVSASGLSVIRCEAIEVPTVFEDFDDYWHPFTLGAGPAPGYCISLEPAARQELKEKLFQTLPRDNSGTISMKARAWALKAAVS